LIKADVIDVPCVL